VKVTVCRNTSSILTDLLIIVPGGIPPLARIATEHCFSGASSAKPNPHQLWFESISAADKEALA
jgi:hypothetical protein